MRKILSMLVLIVLSALAVTGGALAAVADDHSDNVSLVGKTTLPGATDLEFTKDGYVVMTVNGSSPDAGLWIIDAGDPRKPKKVGHLPCVGSGYDVGLWKNVAVMSSDSASGNSSTKEDGCNVKGTDGQEGIRLVDISDRARPKEIKFVETQCGSHTNIVVPRKEKAFVYVQSYPASTSGACPSAHGIISVVDITNPAKAKVVSQPSVSPAVGCHDGAIAGDLAYMACLSEGQIWNISDPLQPEILSHINDVPDAIWHSADTSNTGKFAIFGFESFGPGNSSCTGAGQGTGGALWFYDVADPANPIQLGHFVPPRVIEGLCTAHNFNVIPRIERNALVTAWYAGGFMVVDFTDPAAPVEFGHYLPESTSTWDAKWYRGKAYVGDGSRGLDVYSVKGL